MKTAEEIRIDFYGTDDSRAYDHDELYLMKQYAAQFKQGSINTNVVRPESNVGGGELLQGEAVGKGVERGEAFECPCCGEMIQWGLSEDTMKLIKDSKLFKSRA